MEVFRTIYEHTDMDEALKAALMAKLNERLLTISEVNTLLLAQMNIGERTNVKLTFACHPSAVPRLC